MIYVKRYILLLIIIVLSVVSCSSRTVNKNGVEWFNEKNIVSKKEANKIEVGMMYETVVGLIGKPNANLGFGLVIMEWRLSNGEKLHIWFVMNCNQMEENKLPFPYNQIVDSIEIE